MPDNPQPQEGTAPAAPAAPAAPSAPAPEQTPAPPWGSDEDFKPDKAWKLIQDLRADKDRLAARPVLTDEAKQQLDEYNRFQEASKSELQRANEEKTRWQAEADRWRTQSVSSRIEALAATDFADPSDAVGQLDAAQYLDAGGVINETAIRRDLAAVLDRKPHWRRPTEAPAPRPPAPNLNQGSGGGGNTGIAPRDQFAAILTGGLTPPQ